jgi:hypothetical protein
VPNPAPVAYFYCSGNPAESERGKADEILRSLAKQLSVTRNEEYLLQPTVDEYQRRSSESNLSCPETLTINDSIQLICELGRATAVTIVLDALDECDPEQRVLVLSALAEISLRCRDVAKIFVSSRYKEDIAAHLGNGKVLGITAESNQEDLQRYIAICVDRFLKTWSSTHNETTETLQLLQVELASSLISRAQER